MIDLNTIKAYVILLIFVYNTYALHDSNAGSLNVGTVLFTSSDLNKKRWVRSDIGVLEARRRFQNIIPSPRSIDTVSEDYVNNILKYFTHALSTAKREATNSEECNVVLTALSDVIGGFCKVWVLPVTKFAYYGGTISEESAIKAFEYYDNLKENLNSDGSGWRSPSEEILSSIAISVISPYAHEARRRSNKDPCEHLAYYEKYNDSLYIATPYINWEDTPNSMFLPLKNESLIILDSPSSSNALLKYYDVAKSCCNSNRPDGCKEFDMRFQEWLAKDVVPHLNDDKLYIAFGSVLTLLNKTKELFEKASNPYICEMATFTPCMTSKKFLILVVVLFLEIMWCIPTLLYLICYKRKSKKNRTQFFLDTFRRKKSDNFNFHTIGRANKSSKRSNVSKNDEKNIIHILQPRKMENGVRLFQKPRAKNLERDTQFPSHVSKRSTAQVTESLPDVVTTTDQSVTMITEIPMKQSVKKKSFNTNSSHIQKSNCLHVTRDSDKSNMSTNQTDSISTVRKIDTTLTRIIREKNNNNSKQFIKTPSFHDSDTRIISKEKQNIDKIFKTDEDVLCPCKGCFNEDEIGKGNSSKNINNVKMRPRSKKTNVNYNRAESDQNRPPRTENTKLPKFQTKVIVQKDIKLNKTKGLKLNSGEPLLEIRIDKPPAEITVDLTKYNRPSKIPRRTPISFVNGESKHIHEHPCACPGLKYSTIGKRSADDLDMQRKVANSDKMNVTL